MLNFFDNILTGFYYLMIVSFLLGLIGFFILFSSQFTKIDQKYKRLGVIFFISTFLIFACGFGFSEIFQKQVRQNLFEFININHEKIQIKINDRIPVNPELIIDELKKVKRLTAHHSSPTEAIKIDLITNNGTQNLVLKQDSQIKNEFWVYVNNYHLTSLNEIGRVQSDLFLEYIPENEFERTQRIRDEISNLEGYFKRENLKMELIADSDTNNTDIIFINNPMTKVRLTYLPTGLVTFGLSKSNKDENYLESLLILKDRLNDNKEK